MYTALPRVLTDRADVLVRAALPTPPIDVRAGPGRSLLFPTSAAYLDQDLVQILYLAPGGHHLKGHASKPHLC